MDKRVRSPNYPALSLPQAIEKSVLLYRNIHNHAAPREVVAKGMGYAGLSGPSSTVISALQKYGLLERAGEEYRVSERALRILHPHSPAERAAAVMEAGREPALFSEIAERFPGKMPNEELLRNYLMRKGFAPSALAGVISAYRETSEMVEREGAGYDSRTAPPEEGSETMLSAEPISTSAPVISQPKMNVLSGNERSIGRYDFEGGAFVRIAASPDLDTETALDMVETLIGLKRKELERKKAAGKTKQVVDNLPRENPDEELE
jgi:hypothetical protein